MSRRFGVVAVYGALAVLSAVTAMRGASGAPAGSGIVVSPTRAPRSAPATASVGSCALPAPAVTGSGARVRLTGECGGTISGDAVCTEAIDDRFLSVAAPASGGRRLYLTVKARENARLGKTARGVVVVQLVGGGPAARWIARGAPVLIGFGNVTLRDIVLSPEVATAAGRDILVSGALTCV